jgi:hypothetical protein
MYFNIYNPISLKIIRDKNSTLAFVVGTYSQCNNMYEQLTTDAAGNENDEEGKIY